MVVVGGRSRSLGHVCSPDVLYLQALNLGCIPRYPRVVCFCASHCRSILVLACVNVNGQIRASIEDMPQTAHL
jgi:hypothetical protein